MNLFLRLYGGTAADCEETVAKLLVRCGDCQVWIVVVLD